MSKDIESVIDIATGQPHSHLLKDSSEKLPSPMWFLEELTKEEISPV